VPKTTGDGGDPWGELLWAIVCAIGFFAFCLVVLEGRW